jgi:hypothetical protein
LFISLTAVALLVAVVVMFAPPTAAKQAEEEIPPSDAWLERFSLRAYRPMLLLASRADGHYLKSVRPGSESKRYRRMQRTLLREYMGSLSRDFHRLHAIAGEKIRRANSNEAGRSMALFEQQIGFIFLLWSFEARVMLHALIPHSIDLEPLLANVESLVAETRGIARPPLRYRMR